MINVIGLDPSLSGTGVAQTDGKTFTVPTTAAQKDGRLQTIYDVVWTAAKEAGLAVVEDLPTHGMGAGKTGMVQGVVRLALMWGQTPYVTVPPATLKKFATGKGNATKPDLRMALYQRAEIDLRDDNQVDAWWLREIGMHLLEQPTIQLPKIHLAALDKIRPQLSRH